MGKKPRHGAAQRRVLRPRSQHRAAEPEAAEPEAEVEEPEEPEVAEEEAEPEPEPEPEPESLNLVSSCPHVNRSVKVEQLQQALGPPHSCSGCTSKEGKKQTVKRVHKQAGPGHRRKSCLWVCLACAHIGCGLLEGDKPRFLGHALDHSRRCRHHLALRLAGTTTTWCFDCNKYIIRGYTPAQGFGTAPKAQLLQQAVEVVQEHLSRADAASAAAASRTEAAAAPAKSQTGASRSLRGLVNLGNTCFFNSVMQNLLALRHLQQQFLVEEPPAAEGRLTSALRKFFQDVNATGGQSELEGFPVTTKRRLRDQGSVNPKLLFAAVCGKASRFKSFQQQDSHELLRCLLDGLQVEEESRVSTSGGSTRQQTFVERLFGGQFASTVTCCECGHSSSVLEPFLDLSLPIPSAAKAVTAKQSSKKETKLRRKRVKEANTNSSRPASTPAKACSSTPTADADDTSWLDFVGDDYVNVHKPADLEEDEAAASSSAQQPNTGWEMVQDEDVDGIASLFGAAEEEAAVAACSPAGFDKVQEEEEEEEEEVPDIVEEAILPMTLAGCLSAFTRSEVLSGENAWECVKCSFREQQEEEGKEEEGEAEEEEEEEEPRKKLVKRNATKSVAIKQAPQVLTVHLKRFAQDMRGRLSKLTGHVAFEELLNLDQFQDRSEGPWLYRLAGVVEHLGTMRGGHYVAYVRGEEQCWYYLSDSDVRQASLDQVLRTEAYLLFYERL